MSFYGPAALQEGWLEAASIARGEQRVKFQCKRQGQDPNVQDSEWLPLAQALTISESHGAAPILPDGRVGGNGAVYCGDSIVVSKSGRFAGTQYTPNDFVRVQAFERASWTATFCAQDEVQPSSDTPLLWHALMVAPRAFGWKRQPRFVLHGHSYATAEEAKSLNIPCSEEETLFSTPEDTIALLNLMQEYPYPENQIFVRLNHGFFLLADTPEEAISLFQTKLRPTK